MDTEKVLHILTPDTWYDQKVKYGPSCLDQECVWLEIGIDTFQGTKEKLYWCKKCGCLGRNKVC